MFHDLNLKLAVLSVLMEAGHYVDEAEKIAAEHLDTAEDYKPIEAVMDFYRGIVIPPELLATVTSLQPDGGDLAYQHAMSVWDGEDDTFNITSLKGIEVLENLVEFSPIAMIGEDGIDYTPLLGCKKLQTVDMSFAVEAKSTERVLAALEKRGVDVGA